VQLDGSDIRILLDGNTGMGAIMEAIGFQCAEV